MQQVFLKKTRRSFILLEVFIALLLFSIMVAPFLTDPIKNLKISRDQLIKNEIHRLSANYLLKILKKERIAKDLDTTKMHTLETLELDLSPLTVCKYKAIYSLQTIYAKKDNTVLVTAHLHFKPMATQLPKIEPYTHAFILKNV